MTLLLIAAIIYVWGAIFTAEWLIENYRVDDYLLPFANSLYLLRVILWPLTLIWFPRRK